jgi:argininosuccinate lyase
VTKGVPFREAHHVSGRLVARAVRSQKVLAELSIEEFQAEHAAIGSDIFAALDPETIVERRNVLGGPAKAQVRLQIDALNARLQSRDT